MAPEIATFAGPAVAFTRRITRLEFRNASNFATARKAIFRVEFFLRTNQTIRSFASFLVFSDLEERANLSTDRRPKGRVARAGLA
jgi:hypothetical protein